ncbi:uncharacterized protein N7496_002864 [Penicillium cataractarum]|uniref:Malate dehydrogenase n=1 Tax=Penicillium cataractarum TaxID=2100454 RepID=A0A9W9SKW0_9EURO|nr:uncharacterized protein N7496_002864 [Penicillium cataractarum]KAJ5380436.1 hypothetical protein N7496_002864 [Penicillium cataractarum]
MRVLAGLFLFLAIVLVDATSSLPGPLRLAATFSRISNELDHISLGNCSLANATLPLNDTKTKLPNPSSNLNLKYIALGRGTQNYSCPSLSDSHNSRNTSKPTATGAAATLFDASCIASQSLTLLHEMPVVIGGTPLGSLALLAELLSHTTNSSDLIIGEHYFNAAGDPFFNLKLSGSNAWMVTKKDASVTAPKRVSHIAADNGDEDVAWLRLSSTDGHGIKEVYRVMTFEGSPPSTCAGQNDTILVDYAAEYWFYG